MRPLTTTSCLLAVVAVFTLSACATTGSAPTAIPAPPAAMSAEPQLPEIEARLQRLQDSIMMLEARLLDQQRAIDELKQRPGQGSMPTAAAGAGEMTGSTQQTPTEIYLAAFGDYAAGQYQKSINGFDRFLQFFPANDYASNARYWLAECYLALGQYELAITNFDRVVTDYPKSTKAPDALLKKAAAFYQTNAEEKAIETIQLLKERYPKSSAAKKASESFN